MLNRVFAVSAICVSAFVGAAGCGDQEPSPLYNRNMAVSEGGRPLLPVARTVAGSRDPSILENARATIIRRDEINSPEAAEMVKGTPAEEPEDLTTADTPGEALSNVGKAFLNNLMGQTIPPVGEQAATGEAAPSGDGGETGGSGGASEADAKKVLEEFAGDRAAGRYTNMSAYFVDGQKSDADYYYDTLDEMNTSLSSLLAAYEKVSPGVKSKFEQSLSQRRAIPTVGSVSITGSDASVSATTPDGTTAAFSMADVDGSWRIKSALFDDASEWSTLKGGLEAHVVALDDEVDSLTGGDTPDNSKLDKLIEDAINYLSALPK